MKPRCAQPLCFGKLHAMPKKKIPPAVRKYMAKLGASGGAAGKGTATRKKLNAAAARARWKKAKQP
jgi:hypothetical protein